MTKKFRIFTVNDNTWKEHNKVGIAAINDPMITHPSKKNVKAARQSAISEISSLSPGDVLFFNRMGSNKHPPELLGMFRATSKPYFDPSPLYPGASHVTKNLPFRIEFECIHNFENPINIDEIWELKDKRKIWTLQQSRGDAVGKHACEGITKIEGENITKLLKANNIIEGGKINYQKNRKKIGLTKINKKPLPIDFSTDKDGQLHYEASLQTLLLKDFCKGKHKKIFGNYDDFIPFVPTGDRKELDVLLLKYNGDDIIWYEIIEAKKHKFTMKELQKLIDYERWLTRTKAENPLQIHPVAFAAEFNKEVRKFVKRRREYKQRPIRLVKYKLKEKNKKLELKEIK